MNDSNFELPPISSYAELEQYLREDLGYCGCAGAIPALRDVLRLAQGWNKSFKIADMDDVKRSLYVEAYDGAMARLRYSEFPGLATWFLYFLNDKRIIEHAGNVTEHWLSPKGVALLAAIESYPLHAV